jgi:hypothetical protein
MDNKINTLNTIIAQLIAHVNKLEGLDIKVSSLDNMVTHLNHRVSHLDDKLKDTFSMLIDQLATVLKANGIQ